MDQKACRTLAELVDFKNPSLRIGCSTFYTAWLPVAFLTAVPQVSSERCPDDPSPYPHGFSPTNPQNSLKVIQAWVILGISWVYGVSWCSLGLSWGYLNKS